jgi:alkanesulfonate monooxygenase SsuD/methylene tetrahydromethanopterin reductase-like flavin-dependent oxidoreductase (luciferase family)
MTPVSAERQPHGTAFAIRDPWAWSDLARLVGEGESMGYRAVFLPEIAGRDTLAALTGLAGETQTLRLGTGIVPMASRTTMLTAMGAATVQERSAGRAILGIGTGPAVPGALDRLREQVTSIRALLAGETVDLERRSVRLSMVPVPPPPVWVSALGPRALRLAGEVADGVLLNWATPERVASAAAQVREAAEFVGRDPGDVTVAVYVRANLQSDATVAMAQLRAAAGEYASYPAYARQFEAMGLGSEATTAAAAHGAGRPKEVPDAFVRAIALIGDPSAARDRLHAYREAGADLAVVYPVVDPGAGPDGVDAVSRTLRALAPGT